MLKCTNFCLCMRRKAVIISGSSGRVVFSESEFCVNSVELTGCLFL